MPFVDNDPSKDWIQPDYVHRLPGQTDSSWEQDLRYFKEEEKKYLTSKHVQKFGGPRPTNQSKSEPALRYDGDKSRVDLIPPEFILALGQHFGVGAKKYAERNWEKGMSWSRCYASAQRHMLAFWGGEELDPETGSPHVICAAWNMCVLHWYGLYRTNLDDRAVTVSDREADAAAESHGS
jgi:hypothetical protein